MCPQVQLVLPAVGFQGRIVLQNAALHLASLPPDCMHMLHVCICDRTSIEDLFSYHVAKLSVCVIVNAKVRTFESISRWHFISTVLCYAVDAHMHILYSSNSISTITCLLTVSGLAPHSYMHGNIQTLT